MSIADEMASAIAELIDDNLVLFEYSDKVYGGFKSVSVPASLVMVDEGYTAQSDFMLYALVGVQNQMDVAKTPEGLAYSRTLAGADLKINDAVSIAGIEYRITTLTAVGSQYIRISLSKSQ